MTNKFKLRIAKYTLACTYLFFVAPVESKEGIRDLPLVGKFSIEPNIGTSFSVGGDLVSSASETVSGSIVVGSSTGAA